MLKLFLQNHNFRSLTLFSTFGGMGRGMFSIFMMWAIHAMYQNPMYTGIAGFMFGAPLVAGFLVGPFVDRWNKARVLRTVEFTKFCVVALMLVAHINFTVGVWFFFIAIFIFSASSMFSNPALTALLPRVVDSEDLVKANAAMNIFGIISGIGLGVVMFTFSTDEINFNRFYGITAVLLFVASLFTFLFRYKEHSGDTATSNEGSAPLKEYLKELGEGFSFVKKGALLFITIAILSERLADNIAYVNFPMFIDMRLGSAFSYMMFVFLAMAGSVIGSFICRLVESKLKLWMIMAAGFVVAGVARIMFISVLTDSFARAVVMYLVYVGFGSVVGIFYQVLIQKLPPKTLTARVYTATTSLSAVAAAIGALAGGLLGTHLYIDNVFFFQVGAYIAIGILLCFSRQIRSLPVISSFGQKDASTG